MNEKSPLPIATLTLNPCLDVSYEFSSLVPDQKVPADHTRFDPGGNGINVGRALKRLGIPAINCCILAGEIGVLVERMLGDQLDNLQAIQMDGETRINCAILEKVPPVQYEIDGVGPNVEPETLEQVVNSFLQGAQSGIGIVTGSLPAGVPVEIYGELVARLQERQALAVVDAKGPVLAHALSHHPFLIKPNRYELEMLCGYKLPSLSAVVKEARRLQQEGVTYICVSLGEEGAILVGPKDIYHVKAPQVLVRSTVGAGDSLVGGLVAAFAQGHDPIDALRLGICCGSGTAQKPGTELFTREDIQKLTKNVEVHRLS